MGAGSGSQAGWEGTLESAWRGDRPGACMLTAVFWAFHFQLGAQPPTRTLQDGECLRKVAEGKRTGRHQAIIRGRLCVSVGEGD